MELEYKYKVDEKIFNRIHQLNLPLVKKSHQIDTYFMVHEMIQGKATYLRVREDLTTGKACLELSQVITDLATEETEITLDTTDLKQLHKMLSILGYHERAIIDKQRTIYQKEDCQIVLDIVKDLGLFVEIELMGEDIEMGLKTVLTIANGLGLTEGMRIAKQGYPDLLLSRNP